MGNVRPKRTAARIGAACVFTYMIGYYLRKLLSVTTPILLNNGYTEAFIGVLSFAYMLMYALGQLVNGRLGDRVHPRWMIMLGLCVPGLTQILFPLIPWRIGQVVCFACLGFFLSMLRGPLVKAISENTLPQYARLCCVGISVVTYLGPLIASLLAILFRWRTVFVVGGSFGMLMGLVMWVVFTLLERSGEITFRAPSVESPKRYRELFRLDRFVMFMVLSALFEISCASIDAWISTYLVQHLHFEVATANLIYSGMSVVTAVGPCLCLILLRLLRNSDMRLLQISLLVSAVLYALMGVIHHPILNTVCFLLTLMATSIASAVLWSIYIPGLSKSGQVSTANGVLDFCGYIGAAIASLVISNTVEHFGWFGVLLVWALVPFIGFVIVTAHRIKTQKNAA